MRVGVAAVALAWAAMPAVAAAPAVTLPALAPTPRVAAAGAAGIAASDGTSALLIAWDQRYDGLRGVVTAAGTSTNLVTDRRGRTIADDIRDWVLSEDTQSHMEVLRREAELALRSGNMDAGRRDLDQAGQMLDIETRQLAAIRLYWRTHGALEVHRALWQRWLDEVSAAAASNSRAQIEPLEVALIKALQPQMSVDTLNPPLQALIAGYNTERAKLARSISQERVVAGVALSEQSRQSPCPAASKKTSGAATPKMIPNSVSVQDFYPVAEQRAQIEGRVVVRLAISATGCMQRSALEVSSGSPALDDAALALAEHALFLPAEQNGNAAAADYSLAVKFELLADTPGLP